MKHADKMTSRELGLLLAQQLLGLQDLHYGLWEAGLPVTLANFGIAQQRYTDRLLERIEPLARDPAAYRILDVGCGTGHMLEQLAARGYRVEAVNPSATLNREVRARLARLGEAGPVLYETTFEAMPLPDIDRRYDLLLCSESFQYIPLPDFFARAPRLLHDSGHVLICDFFKTAAHGDGAAGDRSFSGGHLLDQFRGQLADSRLRLLRDEDITASITPNFDLLNEWLIQRLAPAAASIDRYLQDQYPLSRRLFKWLARRKLARLKYKYLSGHRSSQMFRKYKSYRLLLLQLQAGAGRQ